MVPITGRARVIPLIYGVLKKHSREEVGGGGGGGGQNKNNRPINLPKVITFSTDYDITPPNPNLYHTLYELL